MNIEGLFREHYAAMYRLAFAMLRDREECRDVVQDVFARLVTDRHQGTISEGYLLTSVRNGCLNIIARKKREERIAKLYPMETETTLIPAEQQQERWIAINRYIDQELSPQTRRILRMCYDEGMSYKEVAAQLGISTAAVNKHIVQGLRKLRERFKTNRL